MWRLLRSTLVLAVVVSAPARASTSYYLGSSAESAFDSATASLTQINAVIDFSAYNGFLGSTLANANGSGIDFLGLDGASAANLTVSGGTLQHTLADKQVEITFPSGVLALGFRFNYSGNAGFANVCFGTSVSNCDYGSVIPIGSSDIQFFGVVSDSPLTTPVFLWRQSGGGGSATFVIDDFKAYGSVVVEGPPPEAAEATTMLLVGSGLILLPLARRWRRRAAAPCG
jgi:hypothetical protein